MRYRIRRAFLCELAHGKRFGLVCGNHLYRTQEREKPIETTGAIERAQENGGAFCEGCGNKLAERRESGSWETRKKGRITVIRPGALESITCERCGQVWKPAKLEQVGTV